MMPSDRFDRQLPAILDEISQPRTPDYFDDLLGLTAHTRQRPAWTLPERWLPMADLARQPALARQVPWRPIAVLTMILLLVMTGLVLVNGSQHPLPAPFGLARNGLVAYSKDGDIYTADPISGAAKVVVTGPETDVRPIFSLDGTRFAFERKAHANPGPGSLYVARADGSGLTRVTPVPLDVIDTYAFSPDGKEILISTGAVGTGSLIIAKNDGSGMRWLPAGNLAVSQPAYRPPLGNEIVFVGRTSGASVSGLYAIGADGNGLRTLIEPTTFVIDNPRWSPDGAWISYASWTPDLSVQARVHIISAAGQGDHLLRQIPTDALEGWPNAWSNDGSRLLVNGCQPDPADPTNCVGYLSVVPAFGGGPDVKLQDPAGPAGTDTTAYVWAPDDESILATPVDAEDQPLPGSSVIDLATRQSRPVPWAGVVDPSWQRLAP